MTKQTRRAMPTALDVPELDKANVSVPARQDGRDGKPGLSRRRFLQATGATAAVTALAGCIGGGEEGANGGNGTDGGGAGGGSNGSTPTEANQSTPTESDQSTPTESNQSTPTENNQSTSTEGGSSVIDAGRIVLRAESNSWVGEEPSSIRDQQNPTLRLREDQQYELVHVNADGREHELVIGDGAGEDIVETPATEASGATAEVSFQADSRMSTYYCYYHSEAMRGTIEIIQ